MNTGPYYVKKRIIPLPMNLYGKQNNTYYKYGQSLKNLNNYSIPEEEKGLYNLKQNNEYFNRQKIINQNGQILTYKNKENYINQNIPISNINNNVTNLKQYGTKMINRNNINPVNNNYYVTYNNPINNNIIYNNNNINTTGIIYNNNNNNNPYSLNKINGMQLNNNNINNNNIYMNPYLNQPIINKVPVMNIRMKPNIIPIRKNVNVINKGYNSPKKYIIKKEIDIPTQRFATISSIDNDFINEFNNGNNNNTIENNPFLINNIDETNNTNKLKNITIPKINPNITNNNNNLSILTDRRTLHPKIENIDTILNQDITTTPTKIRNNNVTDILDFQFNSSEPYLNIDQIISTPTKKELTPQKQENETNQSLRLTQTFHNYIDNSQNYNTPIKTPSPKDKISNNQTPVKLYNDIYSPQKKQNMTPKINKNPFNKGNSIKSVHYLCRPGKEEDGSTKTNQDTYLVLSNINGIKNFSIFAVLDGHGPHGHLVSKYTSQSISQKIINHPSIKTSDNNIDKIYNNLKQNNYSIIKQAFILTDNQLINCDFDIEDSGTTCVLIIIIGSHLICANVGDSRAIAVYDENNDSNLSYLNIVPISKDFKPDLPEEKTRIINAGGIVDQLKNYRGVGTGPMRVFLPGKNYPGLAMSRSIGDTIAKKLGVIAEPDVIEYELNEKSKFVVMCSDGVWEFLDNEKVKNLGRKFYINNDSSGLCEELYTNSLIEWQCNDSIVDDITVICIFFN